ncbi:MAG: tRNA-dihydrouridine synthase family protein [Planctomycetota bacterium]|nr:MAG: tRNA-dihydrouridine synthase family protein [Planctomycetota bacterium]
MRVMARRFGAGFTFAEVMLDRFVLSVSRGRKATRYLRVSDEDRPAAAQLMGSEPEEFAQAAGVLLEAGFDWIDLNFGCPVRKVIGKCRGGWYLGNPQAALEVIDRVREVLPPDVALTVKMRRGVDDSPASREAFFTILEGAFARGVNAVTVHGRTVKQRYDGPSDWGFLRQVKAWAGTRLIFGSGDLFTAEACFRMMRETGTDAVTVARGAIGNPWIFSRIRALAENRPLPPLPTVREQREVLVEHLRLSLETYGEKLGLRTMRNHAIKYARLHPQYLDVRNAFVRVKRLDDWQTVLERFYQDDAPGRDPVPDMT